jgi:DNA-directed RNA polymerase specialized sigma24 family protein
MADHDAWASIEAVYRADFARFARFARAVTGDRETALEAVQEGFAMRFARQNAGAEPARSRRGSGPAC